MLIRHRFVIHVFQSICFLFLSSLLYNCHFLHRNNIIVKFKEIFMLHECMCELWWFVAKICLVCWFAAIVTVPCLPVYWIWIQAIPHRVWLICLFVRLSVCAHMWVCGCLYVFVCTREWVHFYFLFFFIISQWTTTQQQQKLNFMIVALSYLCSVVSVVIEIVYKRSSLALDISVFKDYRFTLHTPCCMIERIDFWSI